MTERTWTVLDLLQWTTDHFASKGIDSARLDAEVLLAHALGMERLRLYLEFEKPVLAEERARFRELVKGRAEARVPVAQLVGGREFWSLPLRVTPDVLVPRPETETLVEEALRLLPDEEGEYDVLDLGTGSGAIALALASERKKARVTAVDRSSAALAVAADNADQLGLGERVRLLEGDLFEPVAGERFDLVVSNPPYVAVPDRATLPPELAHEPEMALFAGDDGTEVLRRIVADAAAHTAPGGALVLEIDPGQAEIVSAWVAAAGYGEVRVVRDLAERQRAVSARLGEG